MSKIQLDSALINSLTVHPSRLIHDDIVFIFIHDALGSIPQWKGFPQALCNTTNCKGFIYEREGYGQSSPSNDKRGVDYLHHFAYIELKQLLDLVFSKETSFIFIGHSDGGTISLLHASKFPKKIKGIVSIAAHVIVEPETLAGFPPTIKAFQEGKLDGLKKFHGDKTEAIFYAWSDTWQSPEFRNWNICQDITPILCPGLIIQGKQDNYGTIKQVQLIEKVFQNKVEVEIIQKCGHHPHLEKMESVVQLISKWFNTTF
jgi:pimeloyl-ACP methyl ester carboxylesterase